MEEDKKVGFLMKMVHRKL